MPSTLSSWETGFGDWFALPNFDSLHIMSWQPESAAIFVDMFVDEAKTQPVPVSSRNILKDQMEKAKKAGFPGANAASELEFYVFD